MNRKKKVLLTILVFCIFILVPLVLAQDNDNKVPTFQSPMPPFCDETGGVQPCLPRRPTLSPATPTLTPTPGMADANQIRYVFLPLVLRLYADH
jgi:hypothetical protein